MTVVVTGGTGFIGCHVAASFHAAGEPVAVTRHRRDPVTDASAGDRPGAIAVVQVDVADLGALREAAVRLGAESIVHLAAPGPDDTYRGAGIDATVRGLANLVEVARSLELRRVTVASSISVYAGVRDLPYREDGALPLATGDPIAALKRVVEELALHRAGTAGPDVVVVRLGDVYGPGYRTMRNVPSRVAHCAAGHAPEARARPQPEPAAHDYCYVADCARAIRAGHRAERLEHRVYNVGGGRPVTAGEVVEVARALRPGAPYERLRLDAPQGTGAPGGGAAGYMDLGRLGEVPDALPRYGIAEGMAAYIDWLERHEW